jgi:hypothetical protein
MKQHPGSNTGAESTKTASAAGSLLHSMYPMQHVSVLSIPPTRWIATSLGSGASHRSKGSADSGDDRPSVDFVVPCVPTLPSPKARTHCNASCAGLPVCTVRDVRFFFHPLCCFYVNVL